MARSPLFLVAIAAAACSPDPETGVELTLEWSRVLDRVSVSGVLDDGASPFEPRSFFLPAPEGETATGTILFLVNEAKNGRQLTLVVAGSADNRRTVAAVIVARKVVPLSVSLLCGDGARTGDEACDDANGAAGDGCDERCTVERGYACAGTPSKCSVDCGDGLRLPGEACDDGDVENGDGCSALCAIEDGFICTDTTGPTECVTDCGDGLIARGEGCDDLNTLAGDGCDAACAIEPSWECREEPSVCWSCGDGTLQGPETCDDENADQGDGCDACAVEPGWSCSGEPSVCSLCGDGVVGVAEACDDGGTANDDGCSASCTFEPGFVCEPGVVPTRCYPEADTVIVDASAPSCPVEGTGTFADPFCTIVEGVASPARYVLILPGLYSAKVTVAKTKDLLVVGTATLSHGAADALTIQGAGNVVTVRGLTVTGAGGAGGGVKVHQAARATLIGCVIGPSSVPGIKTMGGGSYVRVERSVIRENTGGGFSLDGGGGFELYNNLIVDNGATSSPIGGVTVSDEGPPAMIVHNTITGNQASGVAAGVYCTEPAFINSTIVWGNSGAGTTGTGALCDVQYSLLQGADGASNITGDPLLVGPLYHLDPLSPAVDMGDPSSAVAIDFDGEPRPQGPRNDIGADEAR